MKNKFKIFLSLLLIPISLSGQVKLKQVNVSAGIGEIQSNSPLLTTFDFQIGSSLEILNLVNLKITYFYSKKVEYFLPENRLNKYYPFVKGFTLLALLNQSKSIFEFSEGIGMAYVKNGIFNEVGSYSSGVAFSFSAAIVLFVNNKNSLKLGLLTDLIQTFGSNALRKSNFNVNLSYSFL